MYVRYIQYRILNYRIATNRELVKMNIAQDDKCSFCGDVETLQHLVYKCIKADSFWLDIQTWIKTLGFDNYTVQTFNSCTSRPDVCRCLGVQTPVDNMPMQ